MYIEQDGKITNDNLVLIQNSKTNIFVLLEENQFFQETKSGKRLELYEKKDGLTRRVAFWNMNSVIMSYEKKQ